MTASKTTSILKHTQIDIHAAESWNVFTSTKLYASLKIFAGQYFA
jgi:hypothetical protein